MRQVYVDTETTDLDPAVDRVLEVCAIEAIDGQPTGRVIHGYCNPPRPSTPEALAVHGLTPEFLRQRARPFSSIARELVPMLTGAELVAHRAQFDLDMLSAECRHIGLYSLADHLFRVTCTREWAKRLLPGLPDKAYRLDALCAHFGIDARARAERHSARVDAGLLIPLYHALTIEEARHVA